MTEAQYEKRYREFAEEIYMLRAINRELLEALEQLVEVVDEIGIKDVVIAAQIAITRAKEEMTR